MRRLILIIATALILLGCAPLRSVPEGRSSAAPFIGISCGYSETLTSVNNTYIDAVRLAGGIPVLIPLVTDSVAAEAIVGRVDAVIMSGGEDIDPLYYGEEHLPGLGKVNAPRDTSDMLLIATALRLGKPMLCICRGEQIMNVALGGTLYQDIPSQIPSSQLKHRQTEPGTVATQTITIDADSRLAAILGKTSLGVNSFHHQAVKDIAPGLRVTARSEDGVVEAFESVPGSPDPYGRDLGDRVLAVQFHPESFAQVGDELFLGIFRDLVSRARK